VPSVAVDGSSLSLKVDLSERQLYVLKNGEVSVTFPVAIGAPSFPTPKGSYSIRRLVWNPRWVPPDAKWARKEIPREPGDPKNPMGKVKIFFREPDYYIHGTRAVDSLGQAESHGCIRMRNSDAVEIARMVMASGGSGKPDSWFSRMINRVRSTQSVNLARPVGVSIVA
jgi:lipoprotein-anchoring transpeptidase ErfK/SrfK